MFRVIEDTQEAQVLYEAGLLWYRAKDYGVKWQHPIPWYMSPRISESHERSAHLNMLEYAILLEE